MLMLYNDSNLFGETNELSPELTDEENEKIEAMMSYRSSVLETYSFFGQLQIPSIVMDDFLFLGNIGQASNRELLTQLDIKHIINVCDIPLRQDIVNDFDVVHIVIQDMTGENIRTHFDRTNALLHSFYDKKERCLVHCAAGISRSATIVLAYLMKYHHDTLKESFMFLVDKRPFVCPNRGFFAQLIRYEAELIKSREISVGFDHHQDGTNPIETFEEFEKRHEKH